MHSLHGGGAERQLSIMVNHQDSEKLEMAIFCVNDDMSNVNLNKCNILKIKDPDNYPFKMVQEICSAIDEFQPDIVHTWLPPSISAPALVAARIRNKVAVASYRNKKIFESWIRLPEFFSTLFFANAIVSNNSPTQSSYLFRKLFYLKKNDVIPNAVDVPFEYIRKDVDSSPDVLNILFVGRITDQKNWQVLLRALAGIKNNNRWKLTVCGKGEDEEKFISLAQSLEVYGNINMLGYIKDVYPVMSQSDLLVLPSWYEGMPNVVLEAMTLGLPSVVSSIDAHTSLFDNNSGVVFFDPKKPDELASVFNEISRGVIDLKKLSSDGLMFSKRFTPKIMLEKYFSFYRKILNEDKN